MSDLFGFRVFEVRVKKRANEELPTETSRTRAELTQLQWRFVKIDSQIDFERLITSIDEKLKRAGVPIKRRPIEGLRQAAIELDTELIGGPLNTGPIPGNYSGQSLSAHIFQWFTRRYGERLKIDSSVGSAIFIEQGDPWLVSFPLMGGRIFLECNSHLGDRGHTIGGPAIPANRTYPKLNVLDRIIDLPKIQARAFEEKRGSEFLVWFADLHRFFLELNLRALSDPLARAIQYDLSIAAQLICRSDEQYSQARWHALQAAEKSLKRFIAEAGDDYSYTHRLNQLLKHANRLGLPAISEQIVDDVQCSAGLRYGEEVSSVENAIKSQQQALVIARYCLPQRRVNLGKV